MPIELLAANAEAQDATSWGAIIAICGAFYAGFSVIGLLVKVAFNRRRNGGAVVATCPNHELFCNRISTVEKCLAVHDERFDAIKAILQRIEAAVASPQKGK